MKKVKISFTGFPGWHIECSAMSMKYLGEQFDIHTGGIDHISVHHTNEIAQAEAATGKKFVNYWLHGAFLEYKGEKISRSIISGVFAEGGEKISKPTESLFRISELEEKGFQPLAYRYLVLTGHYRSPLEFSLESLESAQNSYKRMKNIIAEIKDDGKTNKKCLEKFKSAIENDLDMPNALAALWGLLRDEKAEGKISAIKEFDKVLGLGLLKKESVSVPEEVQALIEEREKARKEKNWALSDELREKIREKGFAVDDSTSGTKIKKI